MNNLIKRMNSTLGLGVITGGDSLERRVAECQFSEAKKSIEQLTGENKTIAQQVKKLQNALAQCQHEASFSIGNSQALFRQLEKIRKIAKDGLLL
jgi:cell division protein FtsB